MCKFVELLYISFFGIMVMDRCIFDIKYITIYEINNTIKGVTNGNTIPLLSLNDIIFNILINGDKLTLKTVFNNRLLIPTSNNISIPI